MEKLQPANTHMIIGLTGNIGSGKSSVRKMLEHSGALGIDADRIAQDALKKDSPAFPLVRERFGEKIINSRGEIDRKKLGDIVFRDAAKLRQLEEIVHPLVSKACQRIIAHSPLPIVVIEAIKLLESDLAESCRSIWVVESRPEVVYRRLKRSRGMSRGEVDARLAKQSPVAEKKRQAQVVIDNSAGSQDTWQQVQAALTSLHTESDLSNTTYAPPDPSSILQPSEESIKELRSKLQGCPNSLLNRMLAERMTGQSNKTVRKDWYEDDNLVFRSLFDFYFTQTEKIPLACWEYDHFACTICGRIQSGEEMISEDLHALLDRMEQFGGERLCRSYSIPLIKEEEVSFIRDLGYEERQGSSIFYEVYEKAGYNLYTKIDPLPFKYF